MAQITSSVGLVSGVNTSALISAYTSNQSQLITQATNEAGRVTAQQQAYQSIATPLNAILQIGQSLQLPTTFGASTATSSDPNTLTATASTNAAAGTYQFQVARLVSTQQSVTSGYASNSALVGPGTITIDVGGGGLATPTPLAQLNGGQGISAGQFRVTDGSGNSAVIDTTNDITLDDVVNQINHSLNISVKASIQNNHLVLADKSGGNGTLTVADLGNGTAAQQLGIAGNATGTTLTGTSVDTIGSSTALNSLNDGRGVSDNQNSGGTGADFQVTLGDGSSVQVTLGDSQSIGDVIKTINAASSGKVVASVNASGTGLQLTDKSGGGGVMSVVALNGSNAASDLGIAQAGVGSITGAPLIAGLDSTLVSTLNGGKGVALGQVSVTDRSGNSTTVDLSNAVSVQDILDSINSAATTNGVKITASLNSAGTGIQIVDNSGGTGNLVVANGDANNTATALGIAGSFNTTVPVDDSGSLHAQYVTQNSLLSSYGGGQGVQPGTFQITNSQGATTSVNLSQGTFNTLGDVISAINSAKAGVAASIDSEGNGLLLTDTAGGSSKLSVKDTTGNAAQSLNISGTSTAADGKTIDGSFEKTISVNSADTLQTVQNKINALNIGVTASIINDGSSGSPYRLSLTAANSGVGGQFHLDAGTTSLQTQDLVKAQDAAVFYGGAGATQPILISSSSNQLSNVIPGVTINLTGTSSSPVTLTVARDPGAISTQLNNFATQFNSVVTTLNQLTSYNTSTNQAGLLLGDPTAQTVQTEIYSVLNASVQGAGTFQSLSDLGFTVNGDGTIAFNQDTFNTAYSKNPTAITNLFTQAKTGLGTVLTNSMNTLVDPVSGVIPVENNSLTTESLNFQSQITQLNQVLRQQQTYYQNVFANMETTLATLQGQQSDLSGLAASNASLNAQIAASSSNSTSPTPTPTSTSSTSTTSG